SIKEGSVNSKKDKSKFYFNFLNYLLLAQVILVVSNIALVYKKKPILMRNNVSACPSSRMNLEMMLGHIVTGLVLWVIYMILFLVMYKYDFKQTHVNLMMLNSFVFTISVVSMAVMIANLIKDSNTVQGVMNVVSLGSSFLCGAFVPQELLGKTALTIGRIFPGFYYIQNNNILVESLQISKILPNMMIILGFSVVFIIISVLAKPKGNDNINK
ncbi:MAG: ABC transporter permease, partial [Anaerococcus sp.]|nr:ABC transporter permease [Anaerococcus sp.]